jgi:ribosomal protein S18 acetylase RimI-like enzyme
MEISTPNSEQDIQAMRELSARLASRSCVVDFEENIRTPEIRANWRLWKHAGQLLGYAFVDDFNNLWFDTEPEQAFLKEVEAELIAWGLACIKKRNQAAGAENTLDSTCRADNPQRIQLLLEHGFVLQAVRTLRYARSLSTPIVAHPLPAGFSIRPAQGKNEVEQLVALHRAAFGTDNMTIERRLALMSTPDYRAELDLVLAAPDHELAAFCVCGFDDPQGKIGFTDPIGTHQHYQGRGLARALVSAGLLALQSAGAQVAQLGTSSENIAMQKLAGALGFECVSEKMWFSKVVT